MKKQVLSFIAIGVLFIPSFIAQGKTQARSVAAAPPGQFCTPQKSSGGPNVALTWSVWGNPGELKRFYEFTDAFNKCYGPHITAKLTPIPNTGYSAKLLTQFAGGTAPDVFYMDVAYVGTFVKRGVITELTKYLNGPMSKSKPDSFYQGLWSAAKTPDGKIYGVTVDDNPMIMWYNKKVLQDAGVTVMPETLVQQGKWSWDTFQAICAKVRAKGNYGYVLGNWAGHIDSWIGTSGGKIYDKNKYVVGQDPNSLAAVKYLDDNLKAKNFIYSASLPRGEGDDALFIAQKVAFAGAGRWYLPEFKQVPGLQFDIVPWPSRSGKMTPAYVATAYLSINKASKHPNEAFQFFTNFVSQQGQTFRLQGGGNAVPSIRNADSVVLEGNLPAHASYLLKAREIGFAEPVVAAGTPGLNDYINSTLENIWVKHQPVDSVLKAITTRANKMIADNMAK